MPQSFQDKYPNEMRNLRLNSRKLTTPFDIHETFKDFLNFNPTPPNTSKKQREQPNSESNMPRGISLLKHIPASRSCQDAHIEAHWCSCLNWINLNITGTSVDESSLKEPAENSSLDYDELKVVKNDTNEILLNQALDKNSESNASFSLNLTSFTKLDRVKLDFDQYLAIRDLLKVYKKSVLKVALKAVEFMNSLIDSDFKRYCERIRLHSVQKLAKLELNRKLLTFKKSKDIHGREALFEEEGPFNETVNSTSSAASISSLLLIDDDSLILQPLNKRNVSIYYIHNVTSVNGTDVTNHTSFYTKESLSRPIVFQIALTTWPGNATYELSFKYNRYDGQFEFNKNEISRINNYNGTSSCMLNKRPDLRQYCFCKYV
jgi:hypothetical protein